MPRGYSTSRRAYSSHELYSTWKLMRSRCLHPKSNGYHNYGGRGVRVCERWLDSFFAFVDDMGERPEGYTLDRIDNDGNYSCGRCDECRRNGWTDNCRWASRITQSNNSRKIVRITIDGVTRPRSQWLALHGMCVGTYHARVQSGMTPQGAILKPIDPKRRGRFRDYFLGSGI